MSRARVLVDQDGVLSDWDAEYTLRLDERGPAAARIPRWETRTAFDLTLGLTDPEKEIVEEICAEPGFYRQLPLIEGAKEGLERLLAWDYEVFIVTTPWAKNPTCASDKLAWAEEFLGDEWVARTVITHDKTIVHGDFLIDDKGTIKGSGPRSWHHVVFGDRYNQDATTPFRLHDWEHLEMQPWFGLPEGAQLTYS